MCVQPAPAVRNGVRLVASMFQVPAKRIMPVPMVPLEFSAAPGLPGWGCSVVR
jgi:hypothetical protein